MKILYFTDSHFGDRRPSMRLDEDYIETQIKKIKEVFDISVEEKVDMIIHGGDLFDKAKASHLIVNQITPFFKNNHLPFYMTIGSHDVVGYNLEELDYTGLGNFIRNGHIKILNDESFAHGIHCKTSLQIPQGYENTILVMHETVSPIPQPFDYISLEQIASLNKNVTVFSGHLHKQFYKEINGSRFYNPGPLVRTDIGEISIKPAVVIYDTVSQKGEFKYLTSAKDGKEVFAYTKAAEIKQKEQEFQNFINSINQSFQDVDIEMTLLKLAKEKNIEQNVIDRSLILLRSSECQI